jgi:hypothetical protein
MTATTSGSHQPRRSSHQTARLEIKASGFRLTNAKLRLLATARRKVLYELEFPSTAKPGPKTNCRHDGDNSEAVDRFTKTAAIPLKTNGAISHSAHSP